MDAAGEGKEDSLEHVVGAFDLLCARAKDSLDKSKAAFAALHKSVFPRGTPPASIEEFAKLFGPGSSALEDFARTQTVCGSESVFMLMLMHRVSCDYSKVVAGFPKKSEMPTVPLSAIREQAAQLARDSVAMMEKRAVEAAERAARAFRSRSESTS